MPKDTNTKQFVLPDKIIIPSPQRVFLARGLWATQPRMNKRFFQIRDDHWAIVRHAATLLDMPLYNFIRWVILMAAREVIYQHAVQTGQRPPDFIREFENNKDELSPIAPEIKLDNPLPVQKPTDVVLPEAMKPVEAKDPSTLVTAASVRKIVL